MNKYLKEYRIKNADKLKEYWDSFITNQERAEYKKDYELHRRMRPLALGRMKMTLPPPTIIIVNAPTENEIKPIVKQNVKKEVLQKPPKPHRDKPTESNKKYGAERFPTEESWLEHKREYEKRWKNEDKSRRIAASIRCKLWELLMGQRKHYKFREMLGCDDTFLKKHLESLFIDGMSWDNYGQYGWHVDHIIPLSSFDLKDPTQQLMCTHWSNLQPLWWQDNLSKGSKIL